MYDSYYGFREPPFRLSPDPAFFFGSKGHNRALAYLKYGLTQKEGFIVVTGTPGTGKTTIARALLQEMGSEKIVVSELNTTHLQADDVLRMVAASYGLEHEDASKATLLKRLENFFLAKYRAGYHCLLMIDESQNLPFESIEELRMLSNFYQGNHALVQIFLLGQEQFRDMLYLPKYEQLRQRVVAATHLEALSARDTRDYITHRLTHVGWTGDNPTFTQRAFAHIYALTKGVPRRINTFCDRLLLFASLEEIKEIDETAVQQVARELSYEGAGKPASEKAPIPDSFSDSEAQKLFEEDEVEETALKTAPEKKPVVSSPEKPKPALKLVAGSGNTAREVELAEPVYEETPEPLPELAVSAELDPWVLRLEEIFTVCKSHDRDRFNSWANEALPPELGQLLQFASGQLSLPQEALDTGSVLGQSSDKELRHAVILYIREAMLASSSSYYRRLGLDSIASDEDIQVNYRLLIGIFQPDDIDRHTSWDKRSTQKINQAYAILRDAGKRRAYDAFLENLQVQEVSVESEQSAFVDDDEEEETLVEEPVPFEEPQGVEERRKSSAGTIVLLIVVLAMLAGGVYWYVAIYQNGSAQDKLMAEPEAVDRAVVEKPLSEDVKPAETINESAVPTSVSVPKVPAVEPQAVEPKVVKPAPPKPVEKAVPKKPVVKVEKIKEAVAVKPSVVKQVPVKPVAKAVQPKPVVKPAPAQAEVSKPKELTTTELKNFLQSFSLSYEEGKIEKFIVMFSEKVITNDANSLAPVRKDYEQLFSSTEMRVIEFNNLKWDIKGQNAKAEGDFVVTILQKGKTQPRRITGIINFGISRHNDSIQIDEMMHSYGAKKQ